MTYQASKTRRFLTGCIALWLWCAPAWADVQQRSVGSSVERHLSADVPAARWVHDPELLEQDTGDDLQVVEVATTDPNTVKLKGLVPSIRFASGVADIPDSTVLDLKKVLTGLNDRHNVRQHLERHADKQPQSAGQASE